MSRGLKDAPGYMAPSFRAAWRDRYGDFPALIDAAKSEHEAGRLHNAYEAYLVCLNYWLCRRVTGKAPHKLKQRMKNYSLAKQLACRKVLDEWSCAMIREASMKPCKLRPYHVDVLAALVTALTLEGGRTGRREALA